MFLTPRANGPHNRRRRFAYSRDRRTSVPKTILAVDDSATMRKVLEITFGGEDFRVVTAEGTSSALSRLGEDPLAAVIDTSLGSDDGYALAKEIRSRDGKIALVLMASRNTPYDTGRGKDAGVDDFIDKPFDTQALIDKVKKALAARDAQKAAAAPAPAGASPRPPVVSPVAHPAPSISSKPAWQPTQRTHTLSFEGGPAGGGPAMQPPSIVGRPGSPVVSTSPKPAPTPMAPPVRAPSHVPASPAPAAVAAPAPRSFVPAVDSAAVVTGRMAPKLGELGLTAQQADAVLALSREVIERVVWEVVPQLAETMIREEIARLTRDG
jgi:CheY-like chemotaxis protein